MENPMPVIGPLPTMIRIPATRYVPVLSTIRRMFQMVSVQERLARPVRHSTQQIINAGLLQLYGVVEPVHKTMLQKTDGAKLLTPAQMGPITLRRENAKISGQRSVSRLIQPRDQSVYIQSIVIREELCQAGIPREIDVNKQEHTIARRVTLTIKATEDV